MSLILKYEGLDADEHRLDAQFGGESLAGIGHGLTLISHYAATATVRQRAPYSEETRFYFVGSRQGSLDWLLQVVISNPDAVMVGLGVNGVTELVKYVFSRAIGKTPKITNPAVASLDKDRSGDLEALVEAVEPALKRGHRVIGESVRQITIINGSNNQVMVGFDAKSKAYLEEDVDAGTDTQDVSVASLNVNSKHGRVYFHDLKRTVPFKIDRDATLRTITQLSRALHYYARKTGRRVNIKFTRIEASDGRLKRILIHDAKHLTEDDV
ncbi:MAG TPA: hypothetical protein VNH53_09965 [Sphingomicrobium sp.]|jgi:hypothetical protein|nr:hypothetical protein [Sphingomicrobium sp.]